MRQIGGQWIVSAMKQIIIIIIMTFHGLCAVSASPGKGRLLDRILRGSCISKKSLPGQITLFFFFFFASQTDVLIQSRCFLGALGCEKRTR